ncbi:MAG TPA: hypothetical protein PKE65_07400, partial [Rhizobiaceae bacterium]|nr:hypothetical protein [Rhizobiaceae bacterium]
LDPAPEALALGPAARIATILPDASPLASVRRSITAVVFGGRTARERDALAAELIEHAFATKPEKAVHPRLASLAPPLALPAPANIRDFVCEKPDGVHRWNANGHPYARAAETLKDREARLYQKDLPRSGDVRIELGGAFGPNPFEFAVVDGGTPPPFIPIPVGRPWHDGDPTPNPHPDLRLAEPQYATGGVAPLPLPRPQLAEKAASTPVSAYQ